MYSILFTHTHTHTHTLSATPLLACFVGVGVRGDPCSVTWACGGEVREQWWGGEGTVVSQLRVITANCGNA